VLKANNYNVIIAKTFTRLGHIVVQQGGTKVVPRERTMVLSPGPRRVSTSGKRSGVACPATRGSSAKGEMPQSGKGRSPKGTIHKCCGVSHIGNSAGRAGAQLQGYPAVYQVQNMV
jgi:hypothetical protein